MRAASICGLCGLLALSWLASGCLASAHIVIGPTVDERGGVGGMVRFRVTAGSVVSLLGSVEVTGRQPSPHTLLAGGLGLATQVELSHDYLVTGNVRALLIGAADGGSNGLGFGGALGVARYVKTYDETADRSWHGWALGGELACDGHFGLGARALLLSPGFVFEYIAKLKD